MNLPSVGMMSPNGKSTIRQDGKSQTKPDSGGSRRSAGVRLTLRGGIGSRRLAVSREAGPGERDWPRFARTAAPSGSTRCPVLTRERESCTVVLYNTSGVFLMTTTTYSHLREHLAEVWDEVESSQEPVILQRRGHEDLALIPAAELKSLQETAHLLRSPKNAARLLAALTRAEARANDPTSLEALRAMLEVASAD